jgi:hypothetical protein
MPYARGNLRKTDGEGKHWLFRQLCAMVWLATYGMALDAHLSLTLPSAPCLHGSCPSFGRTAQRKHRDAAHAMYDQFGQKSPTRIGWCRGVCVPQYLRRRVGGGRAPSIRVNHRKPYYVVDTLEQITCFTSLQVLCAVGPHHTSPDEPPKTTSSAHKPVNLNQCYYVCATPRHRHG